MTALATHRDLPDTGDPVAAFVAHLAVQAPVNPAQVHAARQMCARFGGPGGFAAATLAEQSSVPSTAHRFIDWLIATGRIRLSADYLLTRHAQVGQLVARTHPEFHQRFEVACAELGFSADLRRRQWTALAYLILICGHAPDRFSAGDLRSAGEQLLHAARRHWAANTIHSLNAATFGLEATLFHLGLLDRLSTTARRRGRARTRAEKWAGLPPTVTATTHHYMDQMAVSLRPATIARIEVWLRQFAGFLADQAPPDRRRRTRPHRGVQNPPARPCRRPRRPPGQWQRPRRPRGAAQLLRPPHRVGPPRRPAPAADLRRRHPDQGPATAPVPRRRRRRQTAPRRPRPPRPVRPCRRRPAPGCAAANSSA